MTDDEEIVIMVDKVYKDFTLPQEKVSSIKSMFINSLRPMSHHEKVQQHALKDISLQIKKGDFFGIVGRNGSGKSTLLKILANIYQPTKGKVVTRGKLVPFIELGVGFNPELSGRGNVYLNGAILGFSREEIDKMYESIVDFAELKPFMDQKLKNYSSGMQVRLAFSMAVRAEADILLIDEVLAVGDADFQRKCYNYFKTLKKNKITVVFVSHDMSAIREFCTKAALIDESEIKLIDSPNAIARQYAELFTDQTHLPHSKSDKSSDKTQRWGNSDAHINKVSVGIKNDHLVVRVSVGIRRNIDRLIYGLHIVGGDGIDVTAMNNRMINMPDIENLKEGEIIEFDWKILNIFNDGKYSITLTLVDDASTSLDWYEEAAYFTIKRAERSTTSVLPPLEVTSKITNKPKEL